MKRSPLCTALFLLLAMSASAQVPCPFVPPDPAQPWTRCAYFDTDGDGIPEATDEPISSTRAGNVVTFDSVRYPPIFAGQTQATLSGTDAFGRFDRTTTSYFDTNTLVSRVVTAQVAGYNALTRATSWTIAEQVNTAPFKNFTLDLVDQNLDGNYDALSLVGTGQPQVTIGLVEADIDNDLVGDFVSVPWAQAQLLGVAAGAPQAFAPKGDTNGDGDPDSIALDYDGNNIADPDLQPSPFIGVGSPIVAVVPVPTLGGWGLLGLASLLAAFGWRHLRRAELAR